MADDQGRTLDLEREKRLDATRTLKNSEADLLKARENLKEATRTKDNAEASLAGTQRQAEDQTRRLKEADEQLQIAKEQIVNLKKKHSACVDCPFSSSFLPFGCLGPPKGFASRRRVIDHIAWVLEVADCIIRAEPGSLSIMYSAAPSKFLLLVLFRSMKELY